jgi:hypothetical protein
VIPLAEALLAFAIESGPAIFDRIANVGTWAVLGCRVDVRSTAGGDGREIHARIQRESYIAVLRAVKTEEAVNDARRNAETNGITNATFLAGKWQMVLPQGLSEKTVAGNKIVCIVDQP